MVRIIPSNLSLKSVKSYVYSHMYQHVPNVNCWPLWQLSSQESIRTLTNCPQFSWLRSFCWKKGYQ